MTRNRWLFAALIIFVLLGIGVGILIWTMERNDDLGTRFSIAWPGASAAYARAGTRTIELGPELAQDKVTAEVGAVSMEMEQNFVIRREKRSLGVLITAGNRTIQPDDLHYTLFDKAGEAISSGRVRHDNEITPRMQAKCLIADLAVDDAVKVRIVRDPR